MLAQRSEDRKQRGLARDAQQQRRRSAAALRARPPPCSAPWHRAGHEAATAAALHASGCPLQPRASSMFGAQPARQLLQPGQCRRPADRLGLCPVPLRAQGC